MKTFLRYASVGVINTLLHWAVFGIVFFCGYSQSVSNIVAFSLAVTVSFLVNARWTFNAQATTYRYAMYVLFMGAMAFSVGWAADTLHANPFVTLVSFSAISLFCGFIYSKFVVFREDK